MSEPRKPTKPRATSLSAETLEAILARHHLQGRPIIPLESPSAGNSIYLLGEDLVLRVPHRQPDGDYGLQTIRIAITEARAAGVRTPQIVAVDDTRELVSVPYVILERVPGEPLSRHQLEANRISQVWQQVGHDLALLHHGVFRDGPAGPLKSHDLQVDPRPWLEELANDGLLLPAEASWLIRWLDELEPLVRSGSPLAFCHGDVNADNIMVRPEDFEYLAVVDWDGAGWMDPVWDFVPLPLVAVPTILRAYREVAEVPGDSTAEARLLWHHIQYTLFRWWTMRHQGRNVVDAGFGRLRPGIRGVLELPGARWMAHVVQPVTHAR